MKYKLPAISYSRLSDFIHCKLRYYHGVVEGLSVRPQHLPEPLKLGKAWNALLRYELDSSDYGKEILPLDLTPYQLAKVNALWRAFTDLEIHINKDSFLGCEFKIHASVLQEQIIGFVDRAYEDHIIEVKLSGRPDFYTQRENVAYQLGTYFLANEHWEYCDMQITRAPTLRTGSGKFSDEDPYQFEERIYGDIISRPAHYFLGWDRKTRTFGTRFWRSEFNLDEIHSAYIHVLREIRDTVKHGSWYPNNLACHVPAACPYLPIKRSGVVSEEIYTKRRIKTDGE
jgi:hypothetical protein